MPASVVYPHTTKPTLVSGCKSSSSKEILEFLSTQDTETILKSFSEESRLWPWIDGKLLKDFGDVSILKQVEL